MRALQGILLAVLIVASVTSEGVQASLTADQVCDAEAQVKLSMLAGLRQHHMLTVAKGFELEREHVETEKRLEELNTLINTTQKEEKKLENRIHNMTTPEIEELEAMYTCESTVAMDCCEIRNLLPAMESGLYVIKDPCSEDEQFNNGKLTVYCDMETDGGGWTVIQRRNADLGTVNFTRSYEEYENGFGDLNGEFWIGLKNIYQLTNQQNIMMLQISVWNDTDTSITWNYPYFRIYDQNNLYALSPDVDNGYGDGRYGAFAHNRNISSRMYWRYFSTFDRHHYNRGGSRCGYTDQAGWWYFTCDHANLNGRHQPTDLPGTRPLRQRLVWKTETGYDIYTHSEMKIRPVVGCGHN